MSKIVIPEFSSYEEEANFWDNFDTADLMEEGEEWFHFDVPDPRAIRIAIVPEIAKQLRERARARGISVETLVNVWLMERLEEFAHSSYQPSVAEPSPSYSAADDPAP